MKEKHKIQCKNCNKEIDYGENMFMLSDGEIYVVCEKCGKENYPTRREYIKTKKSIKRG